MMTQRVDGADAHESDLAPSQGLAGTSARRSAGRGRGFGRGIPLASTLLIVFVSVRNSPESGLVARLTGGKAKMNVNDANNLNEAVSLVRLMRAERGWRSVLATGYWGSRSG